MNDDEIKLEIERVRGDWEAFARAKAILMDHIVTTESDPAHHNNLVSWAGTQAALNTLIMCEVHCRGLVEDLQNNIKKDARILHLVEDRDGQPHS